MQRIIEDIKSGQLKKIYLLFGEETYLIRQYRDKLTEAALSGADGMNLNRFEGKGIAPSSIIDMAETLPFFADRRVILLEHTELLKSSAEGFTEYVENMPDYVCMILVESQVDKRTRLYKAIAKNGLAVEFPRQNEQTLKKWILSILKKEQKQTTEEALSLFLEKTGDDMENIKSELEKLICYCYDRSVISTKDIEQICTHQIQNQIFDMIGAMSDGKQEKALKLYYDLLALKEPPMRILALIERQFNSLLQIKELMLKKNTQDQIADKMGMKHFVVGKYIAQARKYDLKYLKQALKDCVDADYNFKAGKIADQLCVELLIVKYSGGVN